MSITFAAMDNRHYRWLLGGNVAQFFAIAARMMVCNLLAWELTGKETALALINLSLAIPMFTGALVAGAYVDRLERKRLITTGLAIIVLSEISIVAALGFDQLLFPHLLLVTFISGCVHPFVHPASIAMMYNFLGQERMANGVALLSSGMNLSRILGPAVTGAVLAVFNTTIAYGMVALLFFVALFCQWQLPRNQPEADARTSVTGEIRNGLRYLFRDPHIGLCLLFSLPPLMLLMSTQYMLVIFANEVWQTGEAGLGILLTSMGAGAFLGALLVARFGSGGKLAFMVIGALLEAVFLIGFSQSVFFWWAVPCLMAANLCAAVSLVTNQVVIQLLAKDEVRGRVSGYILMTYSLAPLALFPISLLAGATGVGHAVSMAAVVVMVVVLMIMAASRRLRSVDGAVAAVEK